MGFGYTSGVALFAAIGTFLFGFDTGITTTSKAQRFPYYKVVAVYIAGEAVGALTQTFIGDRLGRIHFMQFMCIIVTIGTVIRQLR
ncbi:hypothetical protein FQN49_001667 [Arthroderma sp. PD_2]|nr:hypothetical protein FQN49_001667 [Arthroderma sp. PD_2]